MPSRGKKQCLTTVIGLNQTQFDATPDPFYATPDFIQVVNWLEHQISREVDFWGSFFIEKYFDFGETSYGLHIVNIVNRTSIS